MKYLILSFFIFTGIKENQQPKLNGHYYVDLGKNSYQNGYIDFNEDTFTMKPFQILPYTGKVEYYKRKVYLQSSLDILYSIKYEDINKDTIPFNIHIKNSTSYLHITTGQGKFIKTK